MQINLYNFISGRRISPEIIYIYNKQVFSPTIKIINKKVYKYKQYIIYIYLEILFVSIFSLYNSDLFAGCLSHAHPLVSQCIVK
jgi:hypothetical protein